MPDPESAKQHIRKRNLQCYQYKHCTHCFTQVYANSHIHLREDQKYGRWTCALVVEWATVFRWAYETCKAKTQNPVYNEEKPPPLPPPPEASRPQQFSAIVAKYTLQDGVESDDDCFAGNKRNKSDTDNESDCSDSDDEVHTWPPPALSFEFVTWYCVL